MRNIHQLFVLSMYCRGYQGILKATVSGVFEDLKFKIQKDLTKIEVVLTLPCWLFQLTLETVAFTIS